MLARSACLAGALLSLTVLPGRATTQEVGGANTATEARLEQARDIIERLGRPQSDEDGRIAREESPQVWNRETAAALDDGEVPARADSVAPGGPSGAAPSSAPSQAATRVGTIGSVASGTRSASQAKPAKPVVTQPAPPRRGARAGAGGTTIVANAENVTTIAGRGDAISEIGVGSSGDKTIVSAKDVVTTSASGDARTSIGNCSGVVNAQGIYNMGGTIDICGGVTRRDGKVCVEIYRNTCIVHWYIRPKKHPCAPGYWTEFRKCRLPADSRHSIFRD